MASTAFWLQLPWGLFFVVGFTLFWIIYGFLRLRRSLDSGAPLPVLTPGTYSLFGGVVAEAPRAFRGFGWKFTVTFALLAASILLINQWILLGFNFVVRELGALVLWPHPWTGMTGPDLAFLLFVSLFGSLAFVVGLALDAVRLTARQRLRPALFLGFYVLAGALVDVGIDPIPINEAFRIMIRALVGGSIFTAALFGLLSRPRPILISTRPRNHQQSKAFAASVVWASLASIVIVDFIFPYWNSLSSPILNVAFFLLVPSFALVMFGVFGLMLYANADARESAQRPTVEEFHPPVSIIIPAYNEEALIGETIRRADLAAGEYPGSVEIIVGNDGSTDRTSEVARAALSALVNSTGRCIDLAHGGKSNALNGAALAATGEIVVRIDADTPIVRFASLIPYFHDPDMGEVQGRILPARGSGWVAKLRLLEIMWNHAFLRRALMATGTLQVVSGLFCAFRRETVLRAGGWVPWNGEDAEITLRLLRLGYKVRLDLGSLAYEDTPASLRGLQKQRIRWNRGGFFAHAYHYGAIFGPLELGGLAFVWWLWQAIRSARKYMIYMFGIAITLTFQSLDIAHILVLAGLFFIPRMLCIGFFLVRWGYGRDIAWAALWPGFWMIKSYFFLEAVGTMLPGNKPEFSD